VYTYFLITLYISLTVWSGKEKVNVAMQIQAHKSVTAWRTSSAEIQMCSKSVSSLSLTELAEQTFASDVSTSVHPAGWLLCLTLCFCEYRYGGYLAVSANLVVAACIQYQSPATGAESWHNTRRARVNQGGVVMSGSQAFKILTKKMKA
jgi:hypothetical protein